MVADRTKLNQGIDALVLTAGVIVGSYGSIADALNLPVGGLVAVGHASGSKGAVISVPVNYFRGKSAITSIQFDVLLPASLTFQTVTIGKAGTDAGKQVSFSPIPGGIRFIIFGLNQAIIGDGLLATLKLSIGPTAIPGVLSAGIAGIVGSNGAGNGVPISASTGTVAVQ